MPDRVLPKWTEYRKRTDTHTRRPWKYENDQRLKYERGNPQHYGCDDSEAYRVGYAGIDWSDSGDRKAASSASAEESLGAGLQRVETPRHTTISDDGTDKP